MNSASHCPVVKKPLNVLIVDDHPTNLKLLRAQLEAEGHAVAEAGNGLEALELLRRQSIDAVVSDILMPRMDGYRLCYEMRNSEQFHRLPFVFYTNTYLSPSDEKLALDLGADKYLRKPATTADLVAALKEAAAGPPGRPVAQLAETDVLKEYSERLIKKLEEKNTELEAAKTQLNAANQNLEERVKERTDELEAFSYSVSHDLRAPLRHISGYLGMLEKSAAGKLNEDENQNLSHVKHAAQHMGQLIDDLLAFAKLGQVRLQKRSVDTEALLREIISELLPDLAGRNIVWQIAALPAVQGDHSLLRQVWSNLVGNAVKYTRPRNPANIDIGSVAGRNEITFQIRDNGVGFNMDYAEKLFGVFQRLHSPDEFEGTGIGLANVRRIVHRHGGRVWAESKDNAGATFYFSLPNR